MAKPHGNIASAVFRWLRSMCGRRISRPKPMPYMCAKIGPLHCRKIWKLPFWDEIRFGSAAFFWRSVHGGGNSCRTH